MRDGSGYEVFGTENKLSIFRVLLSISRHTYYQYAAAPLVSDFPGLRLWRAEAIGVIEWVLLDANFV